MVLLGLRKERKAGESRVALTPNGVGQLLNHFPWLYVMIEHDAGLNSGFYDDSYQAVSERIFFASDPGTIFENASIIIGVKEIIPEEYQWLAKAQPGTRFINFWHIIRPEAQKIIDERKLVPIWFEHMPGVLAAMSRITGVMSVDRVSQYLYKNPIDGRMVGRGTNADNATLMILGAMGNVGTASFQTAVRRFKKIIIFETDARYQSIKILPPRIASSEVVIKVSTPFNIANALQQSDALISGIHIPDHEAPRLITKGMIHVWGQAKPEAVFVDPAIDQGGSSDISRPTSHANPVFVEDSIIYYGVPNMPGAVPLVSTHALEAALLPNLTELFRKM